MIISDIYKNYKIPPWLQEHMVKVASVGVIIGREYGDEINLSRITETLLLHDMGNIIKITFTDPILGLYDDPAPWIQIQAEFIKTYGENEKTATEIIVKEVTPNTEVHSLIDTIGFTKAIYVDAHYALEAAICCYADQRVAPYGIVFLKERLADGYERYKNRPKYQSDNFQESVDALYRLEERIFNCIDLNPFDISEDSCRSIIRELRSFDISS